MIIVVNESTLVDRTKVGAWCNAINKQVGSDVVPWWSDWGINATTLRIGNTPNAFKPNIVIFDDADQAGALGYHDESPHGVPYGRVFVRDSLDNGVEPSSVLSHEALEMMGDYQVNRWCQAPDGRFFALELCDPVESTTYKVNGIEVSDFVLPAYFDDTASADTKVSRCGAIGPFSIPAGGYAIVIDGASAPQAIFGDDYPEWKKAGKRFAAARTARRHVIISDTTPTE